MNDLEYIKSLEQIKLLSDPRRLAILRLLMVEPATLTHLGRILGEHPAWVRHHLKQLEDAGLVEMVTSQVSGGFVEKYYQARARAFIFQEIILPDASRAESVVLMGSHDLALNLLAERLQGSAGLNLLALPVGSLEGLVALRQGLAHLTGCHLLDAESGEYNRTFIRHFFPDREMAAVTLAHRVQGLMVAPGNPKGIRGLGDLGGGDLTLINRNRGSGTRGLARPAASAARHPGGEGDRIRRGSRHAHRRSAGGIHRQGGLGFGTGSCGAPRRPGFHPSLPGTLRPGAERRTAPPAQARPTLRRPAQRRVQAPGGWSGRLRDSPQRRAVNPLKKKTHRRERRVRRVFK